MLSFIVSKNSSSSTFYIKTEYFPYKKQKLDLKKLIEDPRSLLLNQRSLYSVFLIFDKHNSPKKIRIKTSSIGLFHYKTPATDFPQTEKSRKRFAKQYQRNRLPKPFEQRRVELLQSKA